jgi:uncharacterized membrane protein
VKSFIRDTRGSVATTGAIMMTVIIGFTALGIDLGSVFVYRRKAQASTDLAAIAAVSDLLSAEKAAAATIGRNNLPKDTTFTLQYGVYTPDPSVAPQSRFQPAAAAASNAARVTMTTSTQLYFGQAITGKSQFEIRTSATATRTAFASFAIGSRLASLNGGLLNQLLGGLLGANVSLSAMDYQALISGKIDLFNFMDTLATRLSFSGVTYDSLLDSNIGIDQFVNAMVDTQRAAYGGSNAVTRALADVSRVVQGHTDKLRLGSVIDVGPYRSLPLGQQPKVGVSVSSYDMLSAAAQIANGQHQVQTDLDLNIPGIVSSSVKLAIGERPKGTSWVTVGAEGASVHTAQTRLLITARLAGGPVAPVVNVPVYLELASGNAKLSALKCGFPDVATSSVTLSVTPSLVDAWIGDVSDSDFNNFKYAVNPNAAQLLKTGIVEVTGRSHVAVTNLSAQPVTFAYSDVVHRTVKTVGTKDFSASLFAKLLADTQLDARALGFGLALPPGLTGAVGTVLTQASSPVDQLVSSVLNTLGVGLGQADVWVTGIRCDGAVLVN